MRRGLLWSYESASSQTGVMAVACVTRQLACAHASPVERRRVTIDAVWTNIRRGLITRTAATYLEQSPVEEALVPRRTTRKCPSPP